MKLKTKSGPRPPVLLRLLCRQKPFLPHWGQDPLAQRLYNNFCWAIHLARGCWSFWRPSFQTRNHTQVSPGSRAINCEPWENESHIKILPDFISLHRNKSEKHVWKWAQWVLNEDKRIMMLDKTEIIDRELKAKILDTMHQLEQL